VSDEILRSGVPHNVTTSLVTRNAVLPQNIFIKEEASALRDSDQEGVVAAPLTRNPSNAFDQTPSKTAPQATPNYPVAKDKLASNDALSTIKSHIRDNIQALKNLAHSDNLQRIDADASNQNIQNRSASRSIEENKLYLEKKSIKSNRQLISKTTHERSAPNLGTPNATSLNSRKAGSLNNQTAGFQNSGESPHDKDKPDQDSAFQKRVKELKGHVRIVDNTLQSLDPDK
jgi:hypothetical protein